MSTVSTKIPTYKVIVVGDGAVGKTTLLKRYRTGEYDRRYNATMGVEVHPLKFHTNKGPIIFNVWDTAGQEKFGGLRPGYYVKSDACFIVFDFTSKLTYKNVPRWHQDIIKTCEDIPTIILGNKSDVNESNRKVKVKDITYHLKKSLRYWEVSAKSNYHFDKPFLSLAKTFMGEDTYFVEAPPLNPY